MTTTLEHSVPLDKQLCFSLYGASMAMSRFYKPMLDQLGITFPQYLVLHALWEQDGRTVGGIAERLSLEPSTITPLVKRLDVAGLVERGRDPSDERHVRVRLSDRGRGLEADSRCLIEAVLIRTGLTLERLTALADEVQALRRVLSGSQQYA